ncbi:response regulator transcription factor [Paenibacillus sp. 22594]|uniref:response regulator transcription factor n=1 Tax=Paenibacillus sp. 22594 TaxID=3453947 RepID=UPI003F84DD0B
MEYNFLKSKKIMLVDDERELIRMVSSILIDDGFLNIVTASCAQESLTLFSEQSPDLAILDVMLPDGDGFMLMDKIRGMSEVPIIFLTAKDQAEDKFAGLGLGADDYIVKPFLPKELILRVNAVLRRCYKNDNPTVKLSGCSLDFSKAEVTKGTETIQLTAKEHDLLEVLVRNANRIVTIDALCEAAWGDNPFGYENSLMAHIRRIREKIEENPSKPVSLVTIKGLGYKLLVDSKESSNAEIPKIY